MFLTPLHRCRFLALPRPSFKFFQYCIELETNLASIGNQDSLVNARKLYDAALDLYPQERELWRNYYNMELKVRSISLVSSSDCSFNRD
jgi:U3 small nucleolar RNA-associated protein 6